MSITTRWWWIRHAPDLIADCSDSDRMRWLAALMPAEAVWVTSQLKRTHQTAAAIREHLPAESLAGPAPEPMVEPLFAEQHFGDWQGRGFHELESLQDGAWHRFWLAPADMAPPGGESFADVVERVRQGVADLSERHAGRDIVAVAHGGTIRAAVALALDLAPDKALALSIDNCSLTRLDRIDGAAGSHDAEGREVWRVSQINLAPGLHP
jgi:broad specificity phosphatase PhoE